MKQSIPHLLKSLGRPHAARISRWRTQARAILRKAEAIRNLSDGDLRSQAQQLSWQIRSGTVPDRMIRDVFPFVCEASRRALNMVPYPVQVMGGIALAERRIAEMQTGEGKTLTATLPTTLYAMAGKGCHVITVNDYLAERDRDLMAPLYEMLGLSVGCVTSESENDDRREAYACDITYGTATEIGFDFLRDRLQSEAVGGEDHLPRYVSASGAGGASGVVQRGHYFALIDEADSVLIDDAGTPLIIGLAEPNAIPDVSLMHWSHTRAAELKEQVDYVTEPDRRTATLTDSGSLRVLMADRPRWLGVFSNERLLTQVETALAAQQFYELDREYVVNEGEVTIVDESTGRMMEGRKWQRGLHQAVEVKEGIDITEQTQHAAQVTIQTYFRQYRYLAGMTGTAQQARRELQTAYRIGVSPIPTNRPCLRREVPCQVFGTHLERNQALVKSVGELVRQKRAVLIGTPSVSASEELGGMLTESGIQHQILNARHEAIEADIVRGAGQPGRVTIATNMAGRGTDIIPHEDVVRQGGVHVIATAMHSSDRIDRQLVGRTARQGDPGSFQFMLSLEDPFLRILPRRLQKKLANVGSGVFSRRMQRHFRRAQRQLEKIHARQRKQMLRAERERQETFRRLGLDPYLECAAD